MGCFMRTNLLQKSGKIFTNKYYSRGAHVTIRSLSLSKKNNGNGRSCCAPLATNGKAQSEKPRYQEQLSGRYLVRNEQLRKHCDFRNNQFNGAIIQTCATAIAFEEDDEESEHYIALKSLSSSLHQQAVFHEHKVTISSTKQRCYHSESNWNWNIPYTQVLNNCC